MGLPTRVTSALRWLGLNALSWLTTSELEADRSSYSSLRHCRLRDKVSSFEALWLLFPEVAVISAPEVMAQSTWTYSFSHAISFERASTLSFISWFCCFSEETVSFGIISVKIINKRTVEKRLIKVRSGSLKFNVHLGSWPLNHPFIQFTLQAP